MVARAGRRRAKRVSLNPRARASEIASFVAQITFDFETYAASETKHAEASRACVGNGGVGVSAGASGQEEHNKITKKMFGQPVSNVPYTTNTTNNTIIIIKKKHFRRCFTDDIRTEG
jgi:hypothetical protein